MLGSGYSHHGEGGLIHGPGGGRDERPTESHEERPCARQPHAADDPDDEHRNAERPERLLVRPESTDCGQQRRAENGGATIDHSATV